MAHYRIIATPQGPLATPMISGTFWGHLAWGIRYLEGEKALEEWLVEQETYPWLVSSQMPQDMLPKPMFVLSSQGRTKESLESLQNSKKLRKMNFIPEQIFKKIRQNMCERAIVEALEKDPFPEDGGNAGFASVRMAHNRIDRRHGRTPEEGGLFFKDAMVPVGKTKLQLFVECPSAQEERLRVLLDYIGTSGFGANTSTGCGVIHFDIKEESEIFKGGGNRAMTLSHGTLSNNMEDARYRLHVHFGKMGGHYATGPYSPFKYHILMMTPGATFSPKGSGPFGELLGDVHHNPQLKKVRQHAYHLPIFFTEEMP